MKKARGRGRWSVAVNLKSTDRVALYLVKMRRIARVDSQAIRAKLLNQLDALFNLAFSIAKGQVSRLDVIGVLGEAAQLSLIPDIEKGEVLVDSRGQGSFQRRKNLGGSGTIKGNPGFIVLVGRRIFQQ